MIIHDIKTGPPFNELFPIDPHLVEAIAKDIEKVGYDRAQPIILWAEQGVVIDGHTRLAAARKAGLFYVETAEKNFSDEDKALAYAIRNQRNRRNMTEAEILRCIEAVDKRRGRGATEGFRGNQYVKFDIESIIQGANSKPSDEVKAPSGAITKSAEQTAKVVGVSPRKVERARTVLTDPQEKEAVMTGKKSINRASQDAKKKRNPAPPDEPLVSAQDKRQETLLRAWEELRVWRRKYSQYPEFKEIFWSIDALAEKGKVQCAAAS